MRLSDAIAMGRTMIKLDPTQWINKDSTCGCALGMGFVAIGKTHNSNFMFSDTVSDYWPWLRSLVTFEGESGLAISLISALAGRVYRGEMTLDQLIDWIRSVEPAETKIMEDVEYNELEYASTT